MARALQKRIYTETEMRCLLLLLLPCCCCILQSAAGETDLSQLSSESASKVLEDSSTESIHLAELWSKLRARDARQTMTTPRPPKPTSDKEFERKVRRVLRRQGLLRKQLAETVVEAFARNKYQLLRLDEMMHSAALGHDIAYSNI